MDYDVVPKNEIEQEAVKEEIKIAKEFLDHPNDNQESIKDILRAFLKDILELDAGTIVKVFSKDSYDFDHLEPKSGAPLLKPVGHRKMLEIYARDGSSFLAEVDKFGFKKGWWQYSYQIPAHPMWFNRDEIIYKTKNPRSMSPYGYSPLQAILDVVKSLHYSILYNRKFFEENAIPPGVLSVEDIEENELKDLREYWTRELVGKPHKMPIVNKKLTYVPYYVNNRDLEFLESQKWYFKLCISAFDLTPAELGFTEDVNKSTGASQTEVIKRKGIRPLIDLIERAVTEEIFPELGCFSVKLKVMVKDPIEEKQKADLWEQYIRIGIMTAEEIRTEELGREPLPQIPMEGQEQVPGGQTEDPQFDENRAYNQQDRELGRMQREDSQVREMVTRPLQSQMIGTRPQVLREIPKEKTYKAIPVLTYE